MMTHDYKGALDAIGCMKLIENRSVKHLKGTLYYKHYEAIRAALQLAQEAEGLRNDNERLVRENEVYAERHKAWESCVYAVGLPMMKSVRDTEYGDAVLPVPVVNKITDLLDECFKLRKERDELARGLIIIHEDNEGDYDFIKFKTTEYYKLAKKVRS